MFDPFDFDEPLQIVQAWMADKPHVRTQGHVARRVGISSTYASYILREKRFIVALRPSFSVSSQSCSGLK